MAELMLVGWAWVIAGGFAVITHRERLSRDIDIPTTLILVLAWPWWLSHYSRDAGADGRHDNNEKLVPIRVEVQEERRHRKR